MDRKKVLATLEKILEETINQYALVEVDYRVTSSLSIAKPKDDRMNAAQTNAAQGRQALGIKIQAIRGLIEEVKNGQFTV